VNAAAKLGKINVDPIGIFRGLLKKGRIPDDPCIRGIFKAIRIPRLIKGLVRLLRKIYFEITPGFIGIIAVAGNEHQDGGDAQKKLTHGAG
jgi:hypothetical protein